MSAQDNIYTILGEVLTERVDEETLNVFQFVIDFAYKTLLAIP